MRAAVNGEVGAQLLVATKQFVRSSEQTMPRLAAAVVTTCSHRKKLRPSTAATAVSLPFGPQDVVQSAWLEKIRALPPQVPARALYAGRGFRLTAQAAKKAKAKLFIVSAGLGLVAATQPVPSYGVTVSPGRNESLATRVRGEFDTAAWFSALLSGPYSTQWADAAGNTGRILLALTRPYAEMVGKSLLGLNAKTLVRIRIFGASLSTVLPPALRPALAPYDERLDTILPGTRTDFSQRALFHFVESVATKGEADDRDADFAAVTDALKGAAAPSRVGRPRRTDEEILELITARLRSKSGVSRVLRALRDEEGIACEQARFSRLYQVAVHRKTHS